MGTHMAEMVIEAKGLLFIGDPHLTSIRPGRRVDDYASAVLSNLRQAAKIANEQHLVPVILGDFFHYADDAKEGGGGSTMERHRVFIGTLNSAVDVLKSFWMAPFCLAGNHDTSKASLSDDDTLSLLGKVGLLNLCNRFTQDGWFALGGHAKPVRVFGCPYADPIPKDLGCDSETFSVLVTHHDLAFSGAHPGAASIPTVQGCDMMVNGHLHKTMPSVTRGRMRAHNPGNISRLSVDVADHVESVWSWTPGQGKELEQHPLEFERDVFDLTGRQLPAASATAAVTQLMMRPIKTALPASQFAQLLAEQGSDESARSEDGAEFLSLLESSMEELGVSAQTRALMRALGAGR